MNSKYPNSDGDAILFGLAALFEPTDVIELRAIYSKGKKRTDAGYFDGEHREALANEAARLNAGGAAVYVTLNRLDPQLLGRYCNRVEAYATATATDSNVNRRRWLLLDFDPVRPKDTSATDAQLEAAKAKARACYLALRTEGWPDPLVAESGNGVHLIYPLDLPNDNASRDLVKGALSTLAARFDDDEVKLDQSVFNAGRITKLYGTVANKGDNTLSTPWRLSRLVSTPKRDKIVTADQLSALQPPAAEKPANSTRHQGDVRQTEFDLGAFLARLGIPFEQDTHEGRNRYKLAHCPFNEAHGKGEAAIFQQPGGKLGFKCQHNGCADKAWSDVRALVDGPNYQAKSERPIDGNADGDSWPDPQPFATKIDPEPYPLDALPETIRAAVAEVLGFTKAPVPLVACSALGALSLAVQAHVDVKRAERLTGPVGLFILSIADSGERKTTVDRNFTSAIHQYEQEQTALAEPLGKDHAAALAAWNAEREGILSAIKEAGKKGKSADNLRENLTQLEHNKPESPRVPRLLLGDETPENLAYTLAKKWPAAGVISSEAGVVLGSHGMGKESVMRNLGLLNVLWDGGELPIGRRTSESFTVKGARLTVSLQIQEVTLRSFFDRSGGLARGTGFLARFLVAWPDSTQGFRPFTEPPDHWPRLAAFHRRISDILNIPAPVNDDGTLSPAMLSFTPEAKAAWVAFHDALEGELRAGGELYDVRDVASKTADNAARLAALFHVFEHGMGGAIGPDSFESASRIAAWHLNEARRFFGELALPIELGNAAKLSSWLIDHCRRKRTRAVLKHHIRQFGPGCVRNKTALDEALSELDTLGHIRQVKDGKRTLIELNPAFMEVMR
jgi:putative DNA primase/helicase